MTTGDTLSNLLKTALKDTGTDAKVTGAELAQYIDDRVAALALAVGEPGYAETEKVAQDNVLLFAAGRTFDEASAVDQRIVGIVRGALAVGVALAPVA